jgi:predicted nucleic acid-binding protein
VSGVVVDTSVWVDFLNGKSDAILEQALARGAVFLTPVVVAELVSGASRPGDLAAITDLVLELPLHETPVSHWIRVGELRRKLKTRGIGVSTPDAHVAQCAMDLDAVLLSRDSVFKRIATHSPLKLES